MSDPVIIDAGPVLNFFATNNERVLFAVLPHLFAPEVVQTEVLRKAKEPRFKPAATKWARLLAAGQPRLEILSDDSTTALADAAHRVTRGSLADVQAQGKDQGETMVVVHADALAFKGEDVTVIIDDGGGQRLASTTIARIDRVRATRSGIGQVRLIDTEWILVAAAQIGAIADRASMKSIYGQLRQLDDGLCHIEATRLLDRSHWQGGTS